MIKMHQVWCLFLLVLIYGTYAATRPSRPNWVESLPTFVDTCSSDSRVCLILRSQSQVEVDNNSGDVFVGSRNVLYHFSSDLKLKHKVKTGPVKDSSGCFIPPHNCSTDKKDTNYEVELLKIVDFLGDTPYVLLCGLVYNKICQVRPIDNLEEYHWVEPYNETLGFTVNYGMSKALFYRGLEGQTSMITATRDNNVIRDSKSAPFLSSKILKKDGDRFYFQYTYQNNSVSSQVVFKSDSSRYVKDNGFMYGGFIYFPVNLPRDVPTSIGIKIVIWEMRLVRFCANDTTFRSYAELPIICEYEGEEMYRMSAAHLGPSKRGLHEMDIYTIFTGSGGSALCVFPMDEVERAFTTYPRRCNYEVVGVKCSRQLDWQIKQVSDFCGPDVSPYTCTRTSKVKPFMFVPGVSIGFISIVKQRGELVAIAGTEEHELIKISMSAGEIINRKQISRSRNAPYYARFAFDQQKKHIYLLIYNKIFKYPVASCQVHETCQECLTLGKKDPLGCGWCSDRRCVQEEECTEPDSFSIDTCTPVIYWTISDRSPLQGSNNFMIIGENFGSYVDAAHNSVLVAGIPCTQTFWNDTQVNCTLGSTPKELSGPLSLFSTNNYSSKLGYSIEGSFTTRKNFTYYAGSRLYGIRPSKGPTSGGTIVLLYGQNLDDDKDKNRTVSVYGRLCDVKEFDANIITCITSYPSSTMNPKDTIALHIDWIVYVLEKHQPPEFNTSFLSQTFDFTPDPFITNIQPGYTTVSGTINLTASGQHFDSVQFPKLVMKVDENQIVGKTEFIEDCWTDPQSNGTVMTCRTPSLKDMLVYPTRTKPLLAHVSFLMDGVQALKDFPKHHRDLSRLLYYPDPEFTVFNGTEKVKKDQKVLQIRGDNLDLMHSKENLKVRIGKNESCDITRVSSDALFCNLASSIFSSKSSLDETNLSVVVLCGSTDHHLGYIELVQEKEPPAGPQEESQEEGTQLWIILVVAVVVVICSSVAFVSYKYCWRRGKKPFPIYRRASASGTAVNNDYRSVPTRTFVPQNVQDEQILKREPFNQSLAVPMVPVTTAHVVQVNAASMISVNADHMLPVNTAPKRVPINAAPPMVPVNAASLLVPPVAPEDRAATLMSSLFEESSSIVDKETLFLFAERNLIISNRYLTVFSDAKLGSGQFGCVYEGLLRHPNEIEQTKVAVKILHHHSCADPEKVKLFLQEAHIMLDFNHPNVVGLHGVCLGDLGPSQTFADLRGPSIVLHFMCNGSLLEYIRKEDRDFIVSDLLKFAVDVAAGMEYLEEKTSLHRDLAARNILLDQDLTAKVSDFGLSRDIYEKLYYKPLGDSKTKVPIKWTAPEAFYSGEYSSKSDVWSYGVLLWEIMTRGVEPYEDIRNFPVLTFLDQGGRLKMPKKCPPNVYKVMLACWNLDSNIRPSFHELHEYMRFLYQNLLRNTPAQAQPEPVYVPAKHSDYLENSKELYLSMEGRPLQWETNSD